MKIFKLDPYYYDQIKKEYLRTTSSVYVLQSRIHSISFNSIKPGFCQITLVEEVGYPLMIAEERGIQIIEIIDRNL